MSQSVPSSAFAKGGAGLILKVDLNGLTGVSDERKSSNSIKPHQLNTVLAALVAAFSSFGLGTVLTWSALVLADSNFRGQFPEIGDGSWVASLQLLGAFCSAPVSGFLIAKLGRRRTLLLSAFPLVSGWALIAFAPNLMVLYVGRFLTGFFAGAFTVSVPTYLSEVCDDSHRGLASTHSAMLYAGVVFTYLLGAFVDWHVLTLVCGSLPLVSLLGMFFMPETPRYLVMKGEEVSARAALQWLRRGVPKSEIEAEMNELLQKSIADAERVNNVSSSGKVGEVLSLRVLKPVGICVLLFVLAQFSGFNALSLYTVQIFRESGANFDEYIASAIFGAAQVVAGALVPLVLVERMGRRGLLIVSGVMMGLSFLVLGVFVSLKDGNNGGVIMVILPNYLGWIPIAALMVITFGYCLGFGPVPWVLTSEILPSDIKELASAIVSMSYWTFSFLSGNTFPAIQNRIGYLGVYWLSCGICLVAVLFVWICVPETKGKSSEEIRRVFGEEKSENNNGNLGGGRANADFNKDDIVYLYAHKLINNN